MKKYYILLIIFNISVVAVKAQDLTYSQFYEQPLLRNPALAGVFTGDIRVSMAFRDQWASVTVPFRTGSLSVEYKIPFATQNDFLTMGLEMVEDGAGDIRLKRTQLLPALNFHKSLSGNSDTYLSVAFMGGPVFTQFDPSQLIFGDQYRNDSYNSSNSTAQTVKASGYTYWDMTTGVSLSTQFAEKGRMYIGGSLAHFGKPTVTSVLGGDQSFLFPKLTFNIGVNSPSGDRARVIAFADYFTQHGNRQLLGGFLYGLDVQDNYYEEKDPVTFYIGSFLRWGDALIPLVKLDFDHMSFGLSYDINISKLRAVSNSHGGFEFTASYKGFLKVINTTLDKVRCTRF